MSVFIHDPSTHIHSYAGSRLIALSGSYGALEPNPGDSVQTPSLYRTQEVGGSNAPAVTVNCCSGAVRGRVRVRFDGGERWRLGRVGR